MNDSTTRDPFDPIAIVGLACRLPGAADTDEFWDLLLRGGDAAQELSNEQFDAELYFDAEKGVRGKSYSKMAALEPRLPADLAKCRLTSDEAKHYDRCHLTMCETASNALLEAGCAPGGNYPRRAGVYFGHTGGSEAAGDLVYCLYAERAAALLKTLPSMAGLTAERVEAIAEEVVAEVRAKYDHLREQPELDLAATVGAQLIARAYGLDGPAAVIDAACASSMQAVAIACRAIQQGDLDMAVVGGASCYKGDSLVLFSQAQSVSAEMSRPFDEKADGLITAEGYVALVLKPLDAAVAAGDRVHGVIRGVGVASDGKGKSLWAPLEGGQSLAVRRAYPHGLSPADLDYVEAHATSTQIGDATELSALGQVFRGHQVDRKIPIGSVKGNIGHTLESAGVAGIAKVLLAMRHGMIPPQANLERLNPKIAWDELPFAAVTEPLRWARSEERGTRIAAVNSFGIGGLNVHVLIESFNPSAQLEIYRPRRGGAPAAAPATGEREPIAVVGRGAILPGALDWEAVQSLLLSNGAALQNGPEERVDSSLFLDPGGPKRFRTRSVRGGFINGYAYDWRRHKVPPKQVANANPLQFMLLDAAEQCLLEAGVDLQAVNRDRIGAVVGTMFGGDFSNELQMGLRLPEFSQSVLRRLPPSVGTSRVNAEIETAVLQRMPALIDETGSFTSSTLASRLTKTFNLRGGALSLDAGAGSGAAALSAAFGILRSKECDLMFCAAGQRNMDITVFEMLDRQGTLDCGTPSDSGCWSPGEGAAVLLLKRLSDAKRDGDKIHAVIHDVRFATKEPPARPTIDCSLPPLDDRSHSIDPLTRQIGYTGATHALVGVIKTTLSPEDGNRVVVRAGDARFGYYDIEVSRRGVLPVKQPIDEIRSSASPVTPFSPRLIRYGASTVDALRGLLERREALPGRFDTRHRFRLALLANEQSDSERLAELAESAIGSGWLPSGDQRRELCRQRVYLGVANEGDLAFVFPGQGAQHQQMTRRLVDSCEHARSALSAANSALETLGLDPFETLVEASCVDLGRDVRATQLALLVAQHVQVQSLLARGVRPQIVAGHSFGEYAALIASGAWGLSDALRCAVNRSDAMTGSGAEGTLAAVTADADRTRRLIAESGRRVYPANMNSPQQTVVGGTREEIERFLSFLSQRSVPAVLLRVGMPFHTPLMAAARVAMAPHSQAAPLIDSHLPVVLTATSRASTSAADFRRSLTDQLTEPVDFNAVTRVLAERQPRLIVDVGPSQTLTKLLSRSGCFHDRQLACVDGPNLNGLEGVLGVVAASEIAPVETPPSAAAPNRRLASQLLEFDATESRRAAMTQRSRGAAGVGGKAATADFQKPRPTAVSALARVDDTRHAPTIEPGLNGRAAHQVAAANGQLAAPSAASHSNGSTRGRQQPAGSIERMLIDFVVEQTGYPEEVVELDADLEADLGIDSIKKAQLFGELGEQLGIAPRADLSLDDFPTLATVRDFLLNETDGPAPPVPEPEPVGAVLAGATAPAPPASPAATSGFAPPSGAAVGSIERMLIDFVVEQTGYPEEVVELDADLEADLGIDSIKKAQLFGELGEQLGIAPRADLSLDDFPTLATVRDFLLNETDGPAPPVPEPEPVGAVPAGAAAPTPPASAAATSGFAPPSGAAVGSIERMLIDFVVEQTGYPEEVVELDADLEADLGIDSIKKAQLFGELGEQLGIAPRADLSLDDFPTLATVRDFLLNETGETPQAAAETAPPAAARHTETALVATFASDMLCADSGRLYANKFRAALIDRLEEAMTASVGPAGKLVGEWGSFMSGIADALEAPSALLSRLANWATPPSPETFGPVAGPLHQSHRMLVAHRVAGILDAQDVLSIGLPGAPLGLVGVNESGIAIEWRPLRKHSRLTDPLLPLTLLRECRSVREVKSRLDANAHRLRDWEVLSTQTAQGKSSLAELVLGETAACDFSVGFVPSLALLGRIEVGNPLTGQVEAVALPADAGVSASEARLPEAKFNTWPNKVMKRRVPRLTPAEPNGARPMGKLGDTVALIGDAGRLSDLVERGLRERGMGVVRLELGNGAAKGLAEVLNQYEKVNGLLYLAPPRCDVPSCVELAQDLLLLCQAWVSRLDNADGAWIAGLTRTGDMGFEDGLDSPYCGAVTGLFKAIRREFPDLAVKVVDVCPAGSESEAANSLLRELAEGDTQLEVCYTQRRRQVVAAAEEPARPAASTLAVAGPWIVTGGARGVTAEIAIRLGALTGGRVHLLGTTPLSTIDPAWRGLGADGLKALKRTVATSAREQGQSPSDAWRAVEKAIELDKNLSRFSEAGVDAEYHACDVSNLEELRRLASTIQATEGPIVGVVHGAGVEAACRFSAKKAETVRATLNSKCLGAENLVKVAASDHLRYFVSFGSTSGRFGGLGQTDYSMASDLLAKIMGRVRRQLPNCRAVCFHWPAWAEVGMAARPESRMALEASGLSFMSPAEGADHLIAELLTESRAHEVLLLDAPGMLDTDSTMSRRGADDPAEERYLARSAAAQEEAGGLLGPATACGSGEWVLPVRLRPAVHRFLLEHRYNGDPLLPAVVIMDLFLQAAESATGRRGTCVEDLRLARGVRFTGADEADEHLQIKVRLRDEACHLELFREGEGRGELASSATVTFGDQQPASHEIDPGEPVYGWTPYVYPEAEISPIWHGDSLRTFIDLDYQHDGGRARIAVTGEAPLYSPEEQQASKLPAAAIDGLLVACGLYGFAMLERRIGLPHGCKRLVLGRFPDADETCTCRFFYRGSDETGDTFDAVLMDKNGAVVAKLEGYQTKIVSYRRANLAVGS